MAKKRIVDPWMPAAQYGRSLPKFTVNLLMRDVRSSIEFYQQVLSAQCIYQDEDFAALELGGIKMMLHADHTYDKHPWYGLLTANQARGLGIELRLFDVDPDIIESKARKFGSPILQQSTTKAHGWREAWIEDPDGYVWAVGKPDNA